MEQNKDIIKEIERQVESGFSKAGIVQNLESMGFSSVEIDEALKGYDVPEPVYSRGSSEDNYGGLSTKQILVGGLFFVIVIFRVLRLISRL